MLFWLCSRHPPSKAQHDDLGLLHLAVIVPGMNLLLAMLLPGFNGPSMDWRGFSFNRMLTTAACLELPPAHLAVMGMFYLPAML
jgi:hypothetical protein